jgi:alkylglycerol monooxygenase
MTLWHTAVPLLAGLAIAEYLASRRAGRALFGSSDTLSDLGCATLSQVAGIAVAAVTVGGYRIAEEWLQVTGWVLPVPWRESGVIGWITVFLLVDLGQYAVHRLSHRVSLLWACHAVHHSSGELNYAVAIRNSSFHGLFIWVFFLPGAVLGIPWEMVAYCYGINVLYQFLLHTRVPGKLGPWELVFNTPSHHRVHHGQDAKYLDRNFGGVLILWDRWFGTFQAEEEEPTYGPPLGSWNAVWANFHGFEQIRSASRRAKGMRGVVGVMFGPPELLPQLEPHPPHPVPRSTALWVTSQLLLAIGVTLAIVLPDHWPVQFRATAAALVVGTIGVSGALLDGTPRAWRLEACRIAAVLLVVGLAIL